MSTGLRWVLVVAALALVVGLLVWARGDTHRRGDEVGASNATAAEQVCSPAGAPLGGSDV